MPADRNIILALVVAGAALAGVGVVRVVRVGLRRMPVAVAAASIVAGLAAASTGLWLRPPSGRAPGAGPSPAATAPSAAAEPSGQGATADIVGRVRDAAGAAAAGVTVVLHRYEGTAEVGTLTSTTAPDGTFAFGGQPSGPTVAHRVTVEREGTVFGSDLILPGVHPEAVEITTAPVTNDPSVVRTVSDSTAIVGDTGGLQVLQILRIEVSGERAFGDGVELPILEGAFGLDPRRGLDRTRIDYDGRRLRSTAPLLPGTTEIVYLYGLRAPRTEPLRVRRGVPMRTERLSLLIGEGLRAEARDLRRSGSVRIGSGDAARPYERYTAAGLDAGDVVTATVDIRRPNAVLRTILVAAGAVVAVAVVVFPLLRRRRGAAHPAEPADVATESVV